MDEPAVGLPEAEVPEFVRRRAECARRRPRRRVADRPHMALIMDVCDRIDVPTGGPRSHREHRARSAPTSTRRRDLGESACARRTPSEPRDAQIDALDVSHAVSPLCGACRSTRQGRRSWVSIGPDGAGKSDHAHAVMGLVATRYGGPGSRACRCMAARRRTLRARASRRAGGAAYLADLTVEENLRRGRPAAARATRRGGHRSRVRAGLPIVKEFRRRCAGVLSAVSSSSSRSCVPSSPVRTS